MKVISFHLKGKMAHFRKFYSNSSALSYFIPPRTTICGIIAGLLGLERDSYYEEFSLSQFKIAAASCKPIKKTMQKVNYLMIKSANDLNGSKEYHSQTPVELVIPQNIRESCIDYKIWIHHTNENIMNKIKNVFSTEMDYYYKSLGISLALGSAFNLGWIEEVKILEAEEISGNNETMLYSAVPVEKVNKIIVEEMLEGKQRIVKEEMTLEFDKKRRITKNGLKDILVNVDEGHIPVLVNSFVKLENDENIVWLE